MTQSNNDIEELEELLTELEGQEAQLVRPYSEDDDAVTQLMDAPLGDQEWMVQVTALDRRMMSTEQVSAELRAGKLSNRTLVWRGGMDDWLPIARVDSLSQVAMSPGGTSPSGMQLPSVPNSGRLGASAALPAPPMWSTLPSVAPLPPPPAVAPSAMGPASGMSMGLPPAAQAPLSAPNQPPPPRPVSASLPAPPAVMSTHGNTARPVAIDFSDMVEDTTSPLRGKRALLALGAVAVLAGFVSIYAFSSKSEGPASTAAASSEQRAAVSALQPAPAEKKTEPAAVAAPAKLVEPVAAAAPAPKPSDTELAANEASSTSSARTTAPARYSPRSEYRRRTRGGSGERSQDDSESTETAVAQVPARSAAPSRPAAAAEEDAPAAEPTPVASAAADDADVTEAPRSTGKSSNTFNREAAKGALAEAATQAKNCRPAGGPSGTGRVEVHYEPSGKVASVNILTSKFDNTTTGSCVKMLFRRAKVPEFTGAPVVTVSKSFEIP